jgi:thiamine biosynthesis lipoprotein
VSATVKENKKGTVFDARKKITALENYVTDETEKANSSQNFNMSEDMAVLFNFGKEYENLSSGKFSAFAYTISKIYGFPEGPYKVPSDLEIKKAVSDIKKEQNVLMDMGAYAKGWIVDEAVKVLKEKGVKSGMVNAGGDLYAIGKKGDRKWRVAVKHPVKQDEYLAVVNLEDIALATSGDYERYFEDKNGNRIHHIFDVTTGKNPEFYRSVSVISKTAEKADGLATVFFLMPVEEIKTNCEKLSTPTLLYTKSDKIIKLCGWEDFEN